MQRLGSIREARGEESCYGCSPSHGQDRPRSDDNLTKCSSALLGVPTTDTTNEELQNQNQATCTSNMCGVFKPRQSPPERLLLYHIYCLLKRDGAARRGKKVPRATAEGATRPSPASGYHREAATQLASQPRPSLERERPCTYVTTWLILPVVICLSQRLSHACVSTGRSKAKPRMAH